MSAARKLAAGRVLAWVSLAVLAVTVALPASADPILPPSDLTLDDLVEGDISLTSLNEEVAFTNFAVEITGGSQDLEDYAIQALWDGFKITSEVAPIEQTLDIVLTYDVTTLRDTLALTAAGFTVIPTDYGVSASLEAYNRAGESILADGRTGNNAHLELPFWVFTEMGRSARIVQRMSIDLDEFSGEWIVRNRFKTTNVAPIPEPNTALLLGAGMVGLARYARRRSEPTS